MPDREVFGISPTFVRLEPTTGEPAYNTNLSGYRVELNFNPAASSRTGLNGNNNASDQGDDLKLRAYYTFRRSSQQSYSQIATRIEFLTDDVGMRPKLKSYLLEVI